MPLDIDVRHRGDKSIVTMVGVIDETAEFELLDELRDRAEFNMKGVRRVNSFGARSWMDVIRALGKKIQLEFVECTSCVIDQLNMLEGFLGHGRVVSFYAAMLCEHCDKGSNHLFIAREVKSLDGRLPRVECETCGALMILDDLEEQYLLFIREPTRT